MAHALFILAVIALSLWLISRQASSIVWVISYAVITLFAVQTALAGTALLIFLSLVTLLFALGAIKPLRRVVLSNYLFNSIRKAMPAMSVTEREALEAGTVSWEGDLFTGAPDFIKLQQLPTVSLTAEEQAFLDGPLNELCRMINDWDITHNRVDLPPAMWKFIKEKGFFGLIIPKEYGGLGFSATAQAIILAKTYSCSISVASTLSVPNSLGPAELLLKYGTQEQKDYYLPRLANGREIPCFALTGPNAGSDAASIPDTGIVCRQTVNGKEVVGIRLNWNKRYITLCPVATVIGLAFRLFDPDNLLGMGIKDIGITCALIPADTPGVTKGRRHFPLNAAFMNGPTQGKNVFIPVDYIIGGAAQAGAGWGMLMECLSAGRAISLPSSAMGGSQAGALVSGAYARVRKQFNTAIANFEGVEELLARLAANAYIIDAGLMMTAAAIDHGAKPSVAGAILKYHTTERARQVANDAMDIHGGKGICLGPQNYLGRAYESIPISITVEGANVLTRSLIIFGQGVIRCHPYVFKEMESVRENNLRAFDTAFWGHAALVFANLVKSLVFNVTDGRFTSTPPTKLKRQYQLVHRYSTNLVFIADFAMAVMGGALKRREKISARLGDVLSALYFASAVLKRFHDDQEPESDLPLVKWACHHLFRECDLAMQGVWSNFRPKWARALLIFIINPFGRIRKPPSDGLGHQLARLLSQPSACRDRLTRFVFKEPLKHCPIGRLEQAFNQLCAVEMLERKVAQAVKEGLLHTLTLMEQIAEAEQAGLLNDEEARLLKEAESLRQQVIAVDDFSSEELGRA